MQNAETAATDKNLTPLMRQYWDVKSIHPDKIVFFRMGDFYEMFFADAVQAAPILGIALTSRNKKSVEETPMCGMPHHSVAGPINKLLAHGLKVAICEQVEDPKTAKGIVKRAVTRVLTPGMVYDPDTLDSTQAHYLASWQDEVLACLDSSTGEAFYFVGVNVSEFQRILGILPIAEIVLPADLKNQLNLRDHLVSEHEDVNPDANLPLAARRLLSYLATGVAAASEQRQILAAIKPFARREIHGRMDLSQVSLRHLEIFTNSRGDQQGTLFSTINRTKTSAGARLLRSRLSFPLTNVDEINARLDQVHAWVKNAGALPSLRDVLGGMGDIERRLGRLAQPSCTGRDLRALGESVVAGISALRMAHQKPDLGHDLLTLAEKILGDLLEEQPLSVKQGHLIRQGAYPHLDELILLTTDSQSLLSAMEQREREASGINSLKIRYNNVFGYYIEITNTHKDKAPAHYMRKQTLANAERYCTDELIELERKVLSAQTRRSEVEFEIFAQLRASLLAATSSLLQLATETAELDVATSAAWLAVEKNYVRPQMGAAVLKLQHSRHPVVEHMLQTIEKKSFTANSIELKPGGCLLLTGPNMAGKSTLMRQVALLSIMAQSGFFVPASSAQLPVYEHLFTRIGASDMLAEGLSTFMVEMTETAEMLRKASAKSLLILDEVGRGTSTFDGMSLAQSILEHILTQLQATTLFATHYHELTQMHHQFPMLHNAHMQVQEKNGDVQFLHTLVSGPAQKSYGIYVAKIAGLPASITKRAEILLRDHERRATDSSLGTASAQLSLLDSVQISEPDPVEVIPAELQKLMQDLQSFDVSSQTPLQALNKISEWKRQLN